MKNMTLKLMVMLAVIAGTQMTQVAHAMVPPAPAPHIPECWTESGMDVEDGSFIVHVDTTKLTKEELLKLMDMIKSTNITPAGYPLIFGDAMFINVDAVDYGVGRYALTRAQLKQAAEDQLREALRYGTRKMDYGTSVQCNHRAYPAPAVGVRN